MEKFMIPTWTLQRFLRERERANPETTGELTQLLASIGLGVKIISQMVATAGIRGVHGYSTRINSSSDRVSILDDEADKVLFDILQSSGHFGSIVSEERNDAEVTSEWSDEAKYVVAFDPLDGSSNIGSNIPVGTIFAIFRRKKEHRRAGPQDFLQAGSSLVAAGYSVYGAKTSFVYSAGDGVHDFTLDPGIGEFILAQEQMSVPQRGSILSVNEGNWAYWDEPTRAFVQSLKQDDRAKNLPYTGRYVGSLVADFDRTLRRGGIFLYPRSSKHRQGRLRLLYECIPLAFMMEQAGGRAVDGTDRILDIVPESIHQRSGLIVGGTEDVDNYLSSIRR
jgi:fructose-1,6-bisphosphatase I